MGFKQSLKFSGKGVGFFFFHLRLSHLRLYHECDVCNGTGHNVFSGVVQPCARCKGSGSKGKTLMGARIKCDACKGKGYNEFS